MPHESTVNPNEEVRDEIKILMQRPVRSVSNTSSEALNNMEFSLAPAKELRPETPPTITHHADFDDDDESDESNKEIIE